MGITKLIKRIWYGPPLVSAVEELAPGTAVVEGKALPSADRKETLVSPLASAPCLAFHYNATYRTPSRSRGWVERVLKDVAVYVPSFDLDVGGGRVKVLCPPSGAFDKEEHRALQSGGYGGFKAVEQLIQPGVRVRVTGRLRRDGERGFQLAAKAIALVAETERAPAKRLSAKERRRKQKKG